MNVLDLIATLTLDTSGWDSKLSSASQSAAQMSGDIQHKFGGVAYAAESLGDGLAIIGGGIVGTAGLGVKAAASVESAFAGVTKTINTESTVAQQQMETFFKEAGINVSEFATHGEKVDLFFENLNNGMWELAERYPVSIEGIMGIAEAAGQLGISNSEILDFTEVVIGLGASTNLSYEEAAMGLARYANVANMSQDEFGHLGATIVELGNNTATTEKDIVYYMRNLANLANTAGMSNAEVAGFAATLSSVGAPAESSRTAMQNLVFTISKAVAQGGETLEVLATTSGMTADQFKKAWEEDATGALIAFYHGLNEVGNGSAEQLAIFEDLGIKQMRQIDIHQRLASANVLLATNVDMANDAYKGMGKTTDEYNALQVETEKRNQTLESKWQMLKNTVKELAVNIGEVLLPRIKEMLPHIQEWVDKAAEYVKENPNVVENITKVGTALLGLGTAISTITKVAVAISSISTVIKLLTGGGAAAGAAGAAGTAAAGGGLIGGLGAAMSALGPIILGVGAVVGVFAVGWHNDWFGCQETFNRVYEETGSKAEAFKAVIRDIAHQILDKVKEIGQNILGWWNNTAVPWFENVGNKIGEFLYNLYEKADKWFADTWNSITEWFNNLLDSVAKWLVNLYENMNEWLTNTWNTVSDWFNTAIDWIRETATTFWNNTVQWFNTAIDWIRETATTFWNNTVQWFNTAIDWIRETATRWWNNTVQWFTTAIDWIRETATRWWNNTVQWFNTAIQWIHNTATTFWNNIVQWFTNTVNWIHEKATTFWNNIVQWFTNLRNKVTETMTNIWNTVTEKITNIWNTVVEKLTSIWNTVVEKLTSIWNTVKEKLEQIWNFIKDTVLRIKEEVVDKVTSTWNTVSNKLQEFKNTVHNIFTQIKETISNKMHEGLSAVSSVVESMKQKIRGVLDAIGDAWRKVQDFVSDAWDRISSVTSRVFGGGRASGGYISAGTTYLVGEEGPELITASKNSYVHNAQETADMFGGNRDIIININGDVYDDQTSMKKKIRGAVLDVLREQVAYG